MTQLRLPEAVAEGRITMADRVAGVFRAKPNTWIDAHELIRVGGFGGWRTRISNLRYPPFNMTIQNRTRRDGGFTVSEYKFVREEQ